MGAFERIKSKITIGMVVSLLIFAIITVVIYAPVIEPYIKTTNNEFSVPLISPDGIYPSTNEDITEYAEAKTEVSRYAADVYISFEQPAVEIGDIVKINVKINNQGADLHRPYFAILIMNNSGYVVGTFPDDGSVAYLKSYYNKITEWRDGDNDNWLTIRNLDNSIKGYVDRDAMIVGQGSYSVGKSYTGKIWFEKQIADMPTQIGQWTVWVIAYDDEYYSADGNVVSTQNAFAYSKATFNVVGKDAQTVKTNDVLNSASTLISFGIYIVSTYGLFTKFAPWINSHVNSFKGWSRKDKTLLGILVILTFLYLALYLLNSSHS